jgi:hypothetical protein
MTLKAGADKNPSYPDLNMIMSVITTNDTNNLNPIDVLNIRWTYATQDPLKKTPF